MLQSSRYVFKVNLNNLFKCHHLFLFSLMLSPSCWFVIIVWKQVYSKKDISYKELVEHPSQIIQGNHLEWSIPVQRWGDWTLPRATRTLVIRVQFCICSAYLMLLWNTGTCGPKAGCRETPNTILESRDECLDGWTTGLSRPKQTWSLFSLFPSLHPISTPHHTFIRLVKNTTRKTETKFLTWKS